MLRWCSRVFLTASLRCAGWALAVVAGVALPQADVQAGAPQSIAYAGVVAPGTGGATFYSSTLPYGVIARGNSIVFPHYTTGFDYGLCVGKTAR